jgi:hypothetical protein
LENTRSRRDRVCHSQRTPSHVKTQPTSMSICRSCHCPVVGEPPCIFPFVVSDLVSHVRFLLIRPSCQLAFHAKCMHRPVGSPMLLCVCRLAAACDTLACRVEAAAQETDVVRLPGTYKLEAARRRAPASRAGPFYSSIFHACCFLSSMYVSSS